MWDVPDSSTTAPGAEPYQAEVGGWYTFYPTFLPIGCFRRLGECRVLSIFSGKHSLLEDSAT